MIYCISDIHGEHNRFLAMLDLLRFSDNDTLYILGDVIDRFPGSIDILQRIMDTPNMIMLLGNHEKMCLDTLGPNNQFGSRELWRQNGGAHTYTELLHVCTTAERRAIIKFLSTLPDHLDIEVCGKKYYLVHGYPSDDPNARLWDRPELGLPAPFKDRTAIVGHTPTCFLHSNRDSSAIWHGNGVIDIDCGCGSNHPNRNLGCLCLDDMREFYV